MRGLVSLSALLTTVFGCVPMKPTFDDGGIPAGPAPGTGGSTPGGGTPSVPGPSTMPCTALTGDWAPAACSTAWSTCPAPQTCTAGTSDTMKYTCAMGQPTVLGGSDKIKLDSITCDTTKGVWIYTMGTTMMSQADLEAKIGTGFQYACVKPGGAPGGGGGVTCQPLPGTTAGFDVSYCNTAGAGSDPMKFKCADATAVAAPCGFECPSGFGVPIIWNVNKGTGGGRLKERGPGFTLFNKVECDTTTGGWKYTTTVGPQTFVFDEAEYAKIYGGPYTYGCAQYT
ncbi:hypothetical protein PENTCL1PPCAC_24357 [Pristionchus entomophagus]|uniref:Uncharacterized protein n=1 Tax=Pristionchus entomophagus TaxID=358040 RepID=A0AAV5U710_9BILA|nr:hypothetical protein PENTCL1PPCAC_24357 [Pristionchus entomophagus]